MPAGASNTLLKVLEQLLHKIKANRRREMVGSSRQEAVTAMLGGYELYAPTQAQMQILGHRGSGGPRICICELEDPYLLPHWSPTGMDLPPPFCTTMTVLLKNLFTVHFQFDLLKLETNNTRDDKLKHAWITVR